MQTIGERIAATSKDCAGLAERMDALMQKEDGEGSLEAAERDEMNTLENDIKAANEKLRRLKSLQVAAHNSRIAEGNEQATASRSRAREVVHVYPEAKVKEEPGLGMARWTIAMARSAMTANGP